MMQDTSEDTPTTVKPVAAIPPPNPVQPMSDVSRWHPEQDVAENEELLDQAVHHLTAVLKQIPGRGGRSVVKAREFLAQFKTPKIFTSV